MHTGLQPGAFSLQLHASQVGSPAMFSGKRYCLDGAALATPRVQMDRAAAWRIGLEPDAALVLRT